MVADEILAITILAGRSVERMQALSQVLGPGRLYTFGSKGMCNMVVKLKLEKQNTTADVHLAEHVNHRLFE